MRRLICFTAAIGASCLLFAVQANALDKATRLVQPGIATPSNPTPPTIPPTTGPTYPTNPGAPGTIAARPNLPPQCGSGPSGGPQCSCTNYVDCLAVSRICPQACPAGSHNCSCSPPAMQ